MAKKKNSQQQFYYSNLIDNKASITRKTSLTAVYILILLILISLIWNLFLVSDKTRSQVYSLADAALIKDMSYRSFVSNIGGVYIKKESDVKPNSLLYHIKNNEITSSDGEKLTLLNSTYFMRMVYENDTKNPSSIKSHVSGTFPLNPENKANPWEKNAFKHFENGKKEHSSFDTINGKNYFNLIRPRYAKAKCLSCHTNHQYREGDLMGGVSVSIDYDYYQEKAIFHSTVLILGHIIFAIIGLFTIRYYYKKISSHEIALKYSNNYDQLTNLPNREQFSHLLEKFLIKSQTNGIHGAILLIDLDRFKNINDSLGHHIGNQLIKLVAQRLYQIIGTDGVISRLGGDEFAILIPELDIDAELSMYKIETFSRQLKMSMFKPFNINNHQLFVTMSMGIVLYPEQGNNAFDLMKYADTAMYLAKEKGRNTYQYFLPSLKAEADKRLIIEHDIHDAINHQEFQLYYQPQVDINGQIVGAEALIRWFHSEKGMISPSEFIPVAEETGQIIKIGDWVLSTAIKQLKIWQESGFCSKDFSLSVNVSSQQFYQSNFVNTVVSLIEESEINAQQLKLEITEGTVVEDFQATIKTMEVLKNYGIRFSLDDFGTGYSSLTYLQKLPLYQLKIDQSFVQNITHDKNNLGIVQAIVSMAKALNLEVMVEGVEEFSQLKIIKSMGCKFIQGYLFYRPLTLEKFTQELTYHQFKAKVTKIY